MITKEIALAAMKLAENDRDPFGIAHPFEKLTASQQAEVREWFHAYAKGFATLHSVVYAVAHDRLDELTK